MRKDFFTICLMLPVLVFSQEGTRPLHSNINYHYGDLLKCGPPDRGISNPAGRPSAGLSLPFMEDFSYAPVNNYPDPNLWSDASVYVNTGMPIAPPSIGVATFDGLNRHGYPYNPDLTNMLASLPADTLTSRGINLYSYGSQPLDPATDNVGLSFYYQARGNGEVPEVPDSLVLDLYKPIKNQWVPHVWYTKGVANANLIDTSFKRVFIKIRDTAYFHDGFKFRFRNSATVAGNFDHWHVDYIYLNKNRDSIADTNYNDLTFAHMPGPLLKDYSSMPWQQYFASEMALKYSVRIKNNNYQPVNMSYAMNIFDTAGTQLHTYGGELTNLNPFKPFGYSQYAKHANPQFGYAFPLMTDSTDYTVRHYVYRTGTANDFIPRNDTILQNVQFRNYYAIDDGSAETGYYVLGTGGKIAVKVRINVKDTLQSVRIYFDPVGGVKTNKLTHRFRLSVWSGNENGPGNLLYQDGKDLYPDYFSDGFKGVPEYRLTGAISQRILPPGIYYIGIQQFVATGITVGFDRNYDFHTNTYFDSGNGWEQSQIGGSVMIRPVFGEVVPAPVGLGDDVAGQHTYVYPNPVNDLLNVQTELTGDVQYRISNTAGQLVAQGQVDEGINMQSVSNGLYLLELHVSGVIAHRQKIIVQH
jgi:hypothetical protein